MTRLLTVAAITTLVAGTTLLALWAALTTPVGLYEEQP